MKKAVFRSPIESNQKTGPDPLLPPYLRKSRVRARWRRGEPALSTAVALADAAVPELIGSFGFDCIWIDLEHSPISSETASHLMRAARQSDVDVMARPGKGEFMRMGRLLEAGANGILYPRCETVKEAREVVRWAKFAPLGERGYSGCSADGGYGVSSLATYVEAANRETFIGVQIESPSALARSRAIAEVEGVDMLFYGPGDFSILSGMPGQFKDPAIWKAGEKICAAALAAGKQFGTITFDREHTRRLLEMGATFLNHGLDIRMLGLAYAEMRDYLAEMGFRFGRDREGDAQKVGRANEK